MLHNAFLRFTAGFAVALAFVTPTSADQIWTLESTIQRALTVAPEQRAAAAGVGIRAGERTAAGAWPNPSLELRADEKLGIEDATGGREFTQLAIRQPLPITRLHYQRRQAEANLTAARADTVYQGLTLEQQAARVFHTLQLAAARLDLARERLRVAEPLNGGNRGATPNDPLVRYLAPAERARLEVLVESARQALWQAEGDHAAALTALRALLALPDGEVPRIAPLDPPAPPPSLDELQRALAAHPALAAATAEREAAAGGIAVARASRFEDPVVSVFRERDFLNGARREYGGVSLSVQVPLWNLNRGGIDKARAERDRAQASLAARERDLAVRLTQSHARLTLLIRQIEHHRARVLLPAQRVYDLTRKGFTAGEVNMLALLDVYATYFDARERSLTQLAEAWLETTELRVATGRSAVSVPNAALAAETGEQQ